MSESSKKLAIALISKVLAEALTQPEDRITITLRTQDALVPANERYNGFFDALEKIVKKSGFLSLWRGLDARLVEVFVSTIYQQLLGLDMTFFLHKFPAFDRKNEPFKGIAITTTCAIVAESLSYLVQYPAHSIHARMVIDSNNKYTNAWNCYSQVYRANGLNGLYKGSSAGIAGLITYRVTFMTSYSLFRRIAVRDVQPDNAWKIWILAQASSILATVAAYPLKTIGLQMLATDSNDTIPQVYQRIIDQEGIVGLYRGFLSCFVLSTIGQALSITSSMMTMESQL